MLHIRYGWIAHSKSGEKKQPYFICRKDDRPFAFAGLAEHWERDDQTIDSCALTTTDPNELMVTTHDRMPVILGPDDYQLWLDPEFQGKEKLLAMLRPCPPQDLVAQPVSTLVNNPRNDVAGCVEPAD